MLDNKRGFLLVLFSLLFIFGFLGLISATTTITQTGLQSSYPKTNLVSTSGTQTQINTNVQNAIVEMTPIQVTLSSDTAYSSVRIAPVNAGSHIQLWAKDSLNNWYNINVVGWGNSTGFPLNISYSATTPVYVISDQSGVYNLNINLIDLTNSNSVIASGFANISIADVISPVNLGIANNFAILAKTGISTTGTTSIVGDIGVSPAAATFITGFGLIADASNTFATSSLVAGKVYAANYAPSTPTTMTTAVSDMQTAYVNAAGRTNPDATGLGAGNIGGMTLAPGLYKWSSGVTIPTDVTLLGGPNDVWIFQISGNLDVSSATHIILSGGAQAKNIFWQVAGQTTLGTTSVFNGNILDQTAIVLNNGATLNGKALAQSAVTLIANGINTAASPVFPLNISNVYLTPAYPNLNSNLVFIHATITSSSGVNYSDLDYQISSLGIHNNTIFSGPLSSGSAAIFNNIPQDGALVQYRILAVDYSGATSWLPSSSTWFNFTYDGSAPMTTDNASNLNSIWINQSVIVNLTCMDTISGCNATYYSTDGSYPSILYISPFTLSQTGQYQLKYYSIDNAGNTANVTNGSFIEIDKIAPTITDNYLPNASNNGLWNNIDQTVTLNPNDLGGSGINQVSWCTSTGCTPSTNLNSSYILPKFTGSQNTIVRYQAFDVAGNPSAIGQFNVLIDELKPTTTDNYATHNGVWMNSSQTITLTPSDPSPSSGLSWTKYCEDTTNTCDPSSVGTNYGSPVQISTQGTTYFRYASADNAGNIQNTVSEKVMIDTVNPTVTINSVISPTNLTIQTITGTFIETNLASITVNGITANITGTGTYSAMVPLNLNGNDPISVIATDLAGNIGTASTSILQDSIVPALIITSSNTTDNMDYFTIISNSTDSGSGVSQVNLALINSTGAVVDTGLMSSVPSTTYYNYLLPMWNLSAGNYTINVTSTDYAGNMNLSSNNITVQNNLAPTQITTINGIVNTSTGGNVSFVFNLISRNSTGQVRFGMDNIAGLTPTMLNATISNGTVNAAVGNSAFVGSQLLTMSNLQTIAPGVVSGTFTLYLTLPANMTVGTYPVNYYINNV